MSIHILFFGQLTDKTGCSSIMLENSQTIEHLKQCLFDQYPALASSKFTIALNNKIAVGNEEITDQSTIALMPPFSGG